MDRKLPPQTRHSVDWREELLVTVRNPSLSLGVADKKARSPIVFMELVNLHVPSILGLASEQVVGDVIYDWDID